MRRHCHCRCRYLAHPVVTFPSYIPPFPCCECPPGPAGAAATITIGTVTTGAPGTPAQVTNSGTPQNTVLNFTIPQGQPGSSPSLSLVSSYSTPTQPGASGTPITFDRNSLSLGNDISHTSGSDTFTITQPGVYSVEFHGVISPTGNNTFPTTIITSLEANGSIVPGGSVPFVFQSPLDSSEQSFTVPISVTNVPTTLQIVPTGGSYLADAVSMTVTRLGDNETQPLPSTGRTVV